MNLGTTSLPDACQKKEQRKTRAVGPGLLAGLGPGMRGFGKPLVFLPDQDAAAAFAGEQRVPLADFDDPLGRLGAVADQASLLVAVDGGDHVGIAAAFHHAIVYRQYLLVDL